MRHYYYFYVISYVFIYSVKRITTVSFSTKKYVRAKSAPVVTSIDVRSEEQKKNFLMSIDRGGNGAIPGNVYLCLFLSEASLELFVAAIKAERAILKVVNTCVKRNIIFIKVLNADVN